MITLFKGYFDNCNEIINYDIFNINCTSKTIFFVGFFFLYVYLQKIEVLQLQITFLFFFCKH